MARAVDGYHGESVGHSMTALHSSPCLTLALLLVGGIAAFVAYGCRVNEQFGTLQGHEPEHPLATPAITLDQGRARILLVEDNPVNQLVAKGMLAKLGCQVQLATQGAEALELLEQDEFDLVLMDCNMPVMDGYEASRRIRQSGRWPDLPIVALTANAMPEERERCRAAGMNDYLAKPFRREELLALVDHWVPVNG